MSAQRHVCRRVSEEKRNAFLGWVNALKDSGAPFSDFTSLQRSGFIKNIARKLQTSDAPNNLASDYDILFTVLSDYYGKEFVDKAVVDSVVGIGSSGDCPCKLEWQTAVVVTLLLNRALTDQRDSSHVLICQKFPESAQLQIHKAFNFLATETNDRPPPSHLDWRSFLSSPSKERYDSPVTTRRVIRPQKLATTDTVVADVAYTPPAAAIGSRRSSADNGSTEHSIFRSPVMEGRGSPLVRNTAKLRERAVEIQKLKRELSECVYQRDMQAIEMKGMESKLRAAEVDLESLRRTEKSLRATVWESQVREEKLADQLQKARAMETKIQKLSDELAAATIDKSRYEEIQTELKSTCLNLSSVTVERDHLKKELIDATSKVQQLAGQLGQLTSIHNGELQELIDKNHQLSSEVRKLHDLVDETHWKNEEIVKLNKDIERLKKDNADATVAQDKQREELDSRIRSLETEVERLTRENSRLVAERDELLMKADFLETQGIKLNNDIERLKKDSADATVAQDKQREELDSRIRFLEREVERLTKENSRLVAERDELLLKADLLETQEIKLNNDIERLRKSNAETTVMLDKQREEFESQIRTLEEEFRQPDKEKSKLLAERDELCSKIEYMEAQEVKLSKEVERWKRTNMEAVAAHEQQREDLESRIHSLEEGAQRLMREKSRLLSDCDELRKKAEEFEHKEVKLKTNVERLMKNNTEATAEHQRQCEAFESRIRSLEDEMRNHRIENRKHMTDYENQLDAMERRAKEERAALKSKITQLEDEVSALNQQRESLLISLDTRKPNPPRLMVPTKRARQDSSRSGTSVGTYGGNSATSAEPRNAKFQNEDEDEVMLQTAVEPGDGPSVQDAYIPAARGDNGITPGRKRLSGHSMGTSEEFKVPARPNEPLARALQFNGNQPDDQEERWSHGVSFRDQHLHPEQANTGTPWNARLSILNHRNLQVLPHLKSSYPVEIQLLPANSVKDEELKNSSAFEPPADLQKMNSRDPSPVTENVIGKKVGGEKSPAARFLSKFAKKSNESKIPKKAVGDQNTASDVVSKAVFMEIPITPNKKTGTAKEGSKWALKKKTTNNPAGITNFKGRKQT